MHGADGEKADSESSYKGKQKPETKIQSSQRKNHGCFPFYRETLQSAHRTGPTLVCLSDNVQLQRGSVVVRVRIEHVRFSDKSRIGEAPLALCRVADRRGYQCDRGTF